MNSLSSFVLLSLSIPCAFALAQSNNNPIHNPAHGNPARNIGVAPKEDVPPKTPRPVKPRKQVPAEAGERVTPTPSPPGPVPGHSSRTLVLPETATSVTINVPSQPAASSAVSASSTNTVAALPVASDRALANRVHAALKARDQDLARMVSVSAQEGVVFLYGVVPTSADRDLLLGVARSSAGNLSVESEIAVGL